MKKTMDKNLEPYVLELKDEDIIWAGESEKEKELNKWLYHTTLELNRYQDMVKELLDFAQERVDKDKIISGNEIIDLVKEWGC